MDDHEVIVPDAVDERYPPFYVKPVQPSHLHGLALRISVIMEVRHEYVVVQGIPVHPHEIHEADVVVGVAMDDDSGTFSLARLRSGGIDGVELESAFSDHGRVLEYSGSMQVVIPLYDPGIPGLGLSPVAFDVVSVLLRQQGIVAHILADHTSGSR